MAVDFLASGGVILGGDDLGVFEERGVEFYGLGGAVVEPETRRDGGWHCSETGCVLSRARGGSLVSRIEEVQLDFSRGLDLDWYCYYDIGEELANTYRLI